MSSQRRKGGMWGLVLTILFAGVIVILFALFNIANNIGLVRSSYEVTLEVETSDRGAELLGLLQVKTEAQTMSEMAGTALLPEDSTLLEDIVSRMYDNYRLTITSGDRSRSFGGLEKGNRFAVDIPLPGARAGQTQGEMVLIT